MHSIKSKILLFKLFKNSSEKVPEIGPIKIKTNSKITKLPNYSDSMPIKFNHFSTLIKLLIREYSINSKIIGISKTSPNLLNKVSIISSPKLNDSFFLLLW